MNLRSTPGFAYYFWIGIALILIFTVLEPVGTEDAGLFKRFIIWTIQIGLLLPLLIGLHILLQAIGVFNNLNPWVKLTLSGLLGSVFFIPLGLYIDYLFAMDDWSAINGSKEVVSAVIDESGGIVLSVTMTWIAINAPRILQINFREQKVAAPTGETVEPQKVPCTKPEFFSLLPVEIGTDVIYLKSELHYVRVATTVGEKLVLYNMKDAIADLEIISEGIQTHRSYWVSGRHIKSLTTDNNYKYIITTNDQRIPVSRRRTAYVKEFIHQQLQNQRTMREK